MNNMTTWEEYSVQSTEEQREQELYHMYDDIERELDQMEEHRRYVEKINKFTEEKGYWFEGIKYD